MSKCKKQYVGETESVRPGAAIIRVVGQTSPPSPQPHFHYSDPFILKHTRKAKITGNYIHGGANSQKSMQGLNSDPSTNLSPMLVRSITAPALSLCTYNTWYLWANSQTCNLLLASQGQAEEFCKLPKVDPAGICKRSEVILNISYLSSSLPNFCLVYQMKSRWMVNSWGWRQVLSVNQQYVLEP